MPEALLSQRIYSRLKREILIGTYAADEPISLDRFARKYRVSRTPVRDALGRLQHEGLLQSIPRVGYFVTRITIKDVQDLFQLRWVVEAASAELAARNITDAQLDRLEAVLVGYDVGNLDSYLRFLEGNRAFHHGIAVASGNSLLAEEIGRLLDRMQRLLFLKLDRRPPQQMMQEHRDLVAALRTHDPCLSRSAMLASVEDAWKAALEAIVSGAPVAVAPPELAEVPWVSLTRGSTSAPEARVFPADLSVQRR